MPMGADMVITESTNRPSAMGPITEGEAHLIGAKADCILKAPGFNGRVIAAGSKAAYINGADCPILAICQLAHCLLSISA